MIRLKSVVAAGWVAPALTLSLLAACGDDDTVAGGQPKSEFRAYCDKVLAIETYPEPDIDYDSLSPEQLTAAEKEFAAQLMPLAEEARAAAPAEVKRDIDILADAVKQVTQTGDFEAAFETPAVEEASDRAHEFDLKNCGWARVDVAAEDYKFIGVPAKFEEGPVSIEFTNKGKEPHELSVFRVNDGVTESVEQIVGLPEEEGRAKVTPVGGTFAPPGEDEHALLDLKKGRYGVACFVPVGGGEEGPPHVTQGMYAEFEVE
jgi:hypothetical protein